MLIAMERLYGTAIEGKDGYVGVIRDVLVDGSTWHIRYLDVDTGKWLPGRRVVLSPTVIEASDFANRIVTVATTRGQVEESPPIEERMPVSRQKELELARHYAWGTYWANLEASRAEPRGDRDPDLRSARAISGYHIMSTDGEIGHLDDYIMDDQTWEIRYLIVDTRNWLPGKVVLIPPASPTEIDWDTQRISVGLTREQIQSAPKYDPSIPINRELEEVLYDFYGRPKYWTTAGHDI